MNKKNGTTPLQHGENVDQAGTTSRDGSGHPILRFPAVPDAVDVHAIGRPGLPFPGTGEAAQRPPPPPSPTPCALPPAPVGGRSRYRPRG